MDQVRFLTDSSLELVARRLRVLGFDVTTLPDARLEELFEKARAEGMTVLTLSARHPRRFANVAAVVVPRGNTRAAVRTLAERYEPAGPAFSRCPRCNHPLETGRAAEASGRIPERLLPGVKGLRHCPACGQWYWIGSHVDRLRAWLEGALGRPVPVPDRDDRVG